MTKLVPYIKNPEGQKRAREYATPILIPKHQARPWQVPFRVWKERYNYFIKSIFDNLQAVLTRNGSVGVDWVGVRYRLERYLYETSYSRYKSFYLLSGPREGPEALAL